MTPGFQPVTALECSSFAFCLLAFLSRISLKLFRNPVCRSFWVGVFSFSSSASPTGGEEGGPPGRLVSAPMEESGAECWGPGGEGERCGEAGACGSTLR